jgi:hypothetical protein
VSTSGVPPAVKAARSALRENGKVSAPRGPGARAAQMCGRAAPVASSRGGRGEAAAAACELCADLRRLNQHGGARGNVLRASGEPRPVHAQPHVQAQRRRSAPRRGGGAAAGRLARCHDSARLCSEGFARLRTRAAKQRHHARAAPEAHASPPARRVVARRGAPLSVLLTCRNVRRNIAATRHEQRGVAREVTA